MIDLAAARAFATRRWPWLALLGLTLVLHLWALDVRSFHHDEAIHAKLSWDLAERGSYHYDPTYHGPLLYYLTAVSYHLLGDSDFSARLPIALAGIGMLWVAWRLKRPLGERAAWFTGLLFTISPLLLYYGRFLRMDLLELFTASMAMLAWYDIVHGEARAWMRLGLWTGLAFATKENAYVSVAILGAACVLLAIDTGPRRAITTAFRWLTARWIGVASSLAVFVLVTVPIYTVGFTRPADWLFPVKAISYWWAQHTIQRVGGPWWFHLPRLAQYELLILVAATVWVVRRWRRLKQVELFLYVFGVLSIVMYVYLGEKVPWLGVHQAWAFVPLAGCQIARSLGPRGRWWSRSLVVLGLVYTVIVSFTANFVLQEITPNQKWVESLHFVQTSPELVEVVREGLTIAAQQDTTFASVSGEAVWPVTWYWRGLPVWWTPPSAGLRPPLVLCDPSEEDEVLATLGPGYLRERIPLRAWWLMYEHDPSFVQVLRYFTTRVPWSLIGSTDVVVFRRSAEDRPGLREVEVPAALDKELDVARAEVLGHGWFGGVRGVAVRGQRCAVADPALSRVTVVLNDGSMQEVSVEGGLNQPEAVAWSGDTALFVADTWNHRVLRVQLADSSIEVLAEPEDGWYGPRSVAVAGDGRVVVADTGHRRLVVYDRDLEITHTLAALSPAGELSEPGGLAWVDEDSILVCDTGNRRMLVVDLDGRVESEVELPDAWQDFYSRPQVVILGPQRWLVSDTPASALWLIDHGEARQIPLVEELSPSGVSWEPSSGTLVVGDLGGSLWRLEIEGEG